MYLELLEKHLHQGELELELPSGKHYHFGNGGPRARWRFHNEQALKRVARDWEYQLGETYINGEWDTPGSDLRDLLTVLVANFRNATVSSWHKWAGAALQQWNRVSRSYANVAHHYDLDYDFFRQFLDEDMHYSCAYFADAHYNLEQAQQAKCALIANKLRLQPGQRVLDIGCGWGSLAMYLAEHHNVELIGITLSREQLAAAERRIEERGVDGVRIALEDYREHRGNYDRIVSVGMFEHVGRPYYRRFFDCVKQMLKPDGIALVHTIGRSTPPGSTNPWISKYIFPGGYIPALSEVSRAVEHSGLMMTDVEILRLHYARTLSEWLQRFRQHREEVIERMGKRFYRTWEFYLACSEVSFREGGLHVQHVQLARQHGVVPVTRDYLYAGSEQSPRI